MIEDHPENQAIFINCNGAVKLAKYILEPELRPSSLQVLQHLALNDNVEEWQIIEHLIRTMNLGGHENLLEQNKCLIPKVPKGKARSKNNMKSSPSPK